MTDIVAAMGPAFLGTRFRRLGERMQAGAAAVIAEAGLPLQTGQMGVIAALRLGPRSVGDLAEETGVSQPGITRVVAQLKQLGMVEAIPAADQRTRSIALSAAGRQAAERIATQVWPRVGQAAEQLLAKVRPGFLDELAEIEAELAQASIGERAARLAPAPLRLRPFAPELASQFRAINLEWITAMFALEETDRYVLDNPVETIIEPGGDILFVEAPGLGIVGTCALRPDGAGGLELTKMGVREAARGLKAGEFLLARAIERAGELNALELYLLTNRKCAAAIHLYEKLGFMHDAGVMVRRGGDYARCDVAMLYTGGAAVGFPTSSGPANIEG